MDATLADLKARYSIAAAWCDLGLIGTPAKNCRSPFPNDHKNGDAHPSFSVFGDGTRWKNLATGEGGDVFDLVKKARSCDTAAAMAWVRERLGVVRAQKIQPVGRRWPELRPGSPEEHARLAALRHVSVEAVRLAVERGFIHFSTLGRHPCWALTDQRRTLVEFRRLDGEWWPAYGALAERKSHCMGRGKDWPIGMVEAALCAVIAWLEGAPDFLTFWHFALNEGRVHRVAPVAMLGAANQRVAAEALAQFRGKTVVIYPHADDAGRTALKAWARQLRDSGAAVVAFDLAGIEREDGKPGKDLNDLCFMSADSYEKPENCRFKEVLP